MRSGGTQAGHRVALWSPLRAALAVLPRRLEQTVERADGTEINAFGFAA